jgi:hypothetical protein
MIPAGRATGCIEAGGIFCRCLVRGQLEQDSNALNKEARRVAVGAGLADEHLRQFLQLISDK